MHTALVGGHVIDGNGGAPLRGGTVVIEGRRIVEVSQAQDLGSEVQVVDVGGRTVMPGIIDCHRHFGEWFQWLITEQNKPLMYLASKTVNALKLCLEAGCTTARDMGGLEAGFRDAVEDGLIPGPRLQTALVIIQPTNGLMDYLPGLGGSISPQGLFATVPGIPTPWCDGPDEARKKVREVLRYGADVVKIANDGADMCKIADGRGRPPRLRPDRTLFTQEELEAIVDEAHRAGVTVACHAYSPRALLAAVRAGVDSIEDHGELDQECCDEMAKRGVWLVTCFLNNHWHATRNPDPAMRAWACQWNESGRAEADLRMAMRAGVPIAMGTDMGYDGVADTAQELGFMVEAGMTPMQAIEASTGRAAECLRLQSLVGALEAGKEADLLVVDGDPLQAVDVLAQRERLALVMKAGEGVWGPMVAQLQPRRAEIAGPV
jgi:imidazolonepropionase-like amidohydrolase